MSENDIDDLVDPIEDGAVSGLSDEEIEKRVDAFNLRVKKNYTVMMSPKKFDTAARLKATHWLGESGEPTAIPYLLRVYNLKVSPDDKKNGIQAAAKESLGMLKALGELLEDDDAEMREMGTELVQNIVFEGKYGKRLSPPVKTLRRIQIGLIGMAVTVFMIAIFLPTPPRELTLDEIATLTQAAVTPSITPTSNDPSVALGDFGVLYIALTNDLNTLRAQLSRAREGQSLECPATYVGLGQYALPEIAATVPNISDAVDAYNAADLNLLQIRSKIDEFCATGQIPTGEAFTSLGQLFTQASSQLNTIATFFGSDAGIVISGTPTPIVVASSTPSPTPTIDPNFINRDVANMQTALDVMRGVRGANTELLGYWQDAQNGGRVGCLTLPAPSIPADILVNPEAAALVPQLQTTADTLNRTLQQTRNSWVVFEAGCSADNLDTFVNEQLTIIQLASDEYERIDGLLDEIRDELNIR